MADTTAADPPVVAFKKRGAKANLRKRPATPPPASDSSDSEQYTSEDESGRKIKRRKKTAVVTASTANNAKSGNFQDLQSTKYAADRSTTIVEVNDATRSSTWYDESDLSAKSLLGKTRAKPEAGSNEPQVSDGTYKGTSSYSTFITKNQNAPQKLVGPMKAPTNVRTITITDFAPDVCKDYKQTGFCGFGDNCKFLHAREDYKQGWALDKEWEVQTKGKKQNGKVVASANKDALLSDEDEKDAALLEKIPFACVICKTEYKNPIVTKCEHYFCERCALDRYRKKPDCAVCGGSTNGVFNSAKGLSKILERKRKREERLKEKADAEEAAEKAAS
jgi:RING finger protein 113A